MIVSAFVCVGFIQVCFSILCESVSGLEGCVSWCRRRRESILCLCSLVLVQMQKDWTWTLVWAFFHYLLYWAYFLSVVTFNRVSYLSLRIVLWNYSNCGYLFGYDHCQTWVWLCCVCWSKSFIFSWIVKANRCKVVRESILLYTCCKKGLKGG